VVITGSSLEPTGITACKRQELREFNKKSLKILSKCGILDVTGLLDAAASRPLEDAKRFSPNNHIVRCVKFIPNPSSPAQIKKRCKVIALYTSFMLI
jgi:hypothetical protein